MEQIANEKRELIVSPETENQVTSHQWVSLTIRSMLIRATPVPCNHECSTCEFGSASKTYYVPIPPVSWHLCCMRKLNEVQYRNIRNKRQSVPWTRVTISRLKATVEEEKGPHLRENCEKSAFKGNSRIVSHNASSVCTWLGFFVLLPRLSPSLATFFFLLLYLVFSSDVGQVLLLEACLSVTAGALDINENFVGARAKLRKESLRHTAQSLHPDNKSSDPSYISQIPVQLQHCPDSSLPNVSGFDSSACWGQNVPLPDTYSDNAMRRGLWAWPPELLSNSQTLESSNETNVQMYQPYSQMPRPIRNENPEVSSLVYGLSFC